MVGRSGGEGTQAPGTAPDDVPEGLDRAAFAAGCSWGVGEYHQRLTETTGRGGCHVATW